VISLAKPRRNEEAEDLAGEVEDAIFLMMYFILEMKLLQTLVMRMIKV
jgi:hypothetical protein